MLSNEQIQEMLEAAKPSIIESIKADVKQCISWEVKEQAAKQVRTHVESWIAENVIPEITAALVESKQGLVSIGVALGPAIVDSVVQVLTKEVSEKLGKSWERKKIFEALIG
jgi:hypothetical protein